MGCIDFFSAYASRVGSEARVSTLVNKRNEAKQVVDVKSEGKSAFRPVLHRAKPLSKQEPGWEPEGVLKSTLKHRFPVNPHQSTS